MHLWGHLAVLKSNLVHILSAKPYVPHLCVLQEDLLYYVFCILYLVCILYVVFCIMCLFCIFCILYFWCRSSVQCFMLRPSVFYKTISRGKCRAASCSWNYCKCSRSFYDEPLSGILLKRRCMHCYLRALLWEIFAKCNYFAVQKQKYKKCTEIKWQFSSLHMICFRSHYLRESVVIVKRSKSKLFFGVPGIKQLSKLGENINE